jgi:hypothetical protein
MSVQRGISDCKLTILFEREEKRKEREEEAEKYLV